MSLSPSHALIATLVQSIRPFDVLEEQHVGLTLDWIGAGSPLFRIQAPDIPPQHLVSYFVLVDAYHSRLLLVDHIKAGLWLPSGGHVEPEEHPAETVRRELMEELSMSASFLSPHPFFLTVTRTVGSTAGHTDVSLWYILEGNSGLELQFDENEFHSVQWFPFDEIPYERADPHMARFAAKLRAYLDAGDQDMNQG